MFPHQAPMISHQQVFSDEAPLNSCTRQPRFASHAAHSKRGCTHYCTMSTLYVLIPVTGAQSRRRGKAKINVHTVRNEFHLAARRPSFIPSFLPSFF